MKFLNRNKFFNRYLPMALSVIVLVTTFSIYFISQKNKVADAAWYSASWTYRKPITIDHNKISTTATTTFSSFPLLFSVTDSDLKFTGSGGKVASSTGGDLLFTASDGTTKLDFELEKYASTTGQTIAWVRIPTMHATYDDTIFIYFGNASATDQSNKTGVWDGNYKQVYHFPNGTTLSMADSTSNTNNLTNNNFTATSTKIDGGISGNGSTSYGNPNSVVSASNYTVSAWFNTSANFAGSYGFIYETSPRNYAIYMDSSSGFGANYFKVSMQDSGLGYHDVHSNVTLNDGNWHYAVGTYDGTNEYLYIDGVKQTDTTTSASAATPTTGTFGANSPSAYTYNGLLDETRISNTPRSADWIKTEYNNQLSPSTFYSYGALGANTTTGSKVANRGTGISWYSSSWSYRKPITIDHNKISQTATTTFSSFPLLFSVTDSDLKFTGSGGKVASSTGGDLLFTASDGITKLDFELEKYASTTGQTIAWVRIPTMHAAYDDTIYIYFGNSGAADQSNKTGVWDSTYGGVWHLPDGTTLTTNDSTGNANNGTNHGAAASAGQVGGGANIGTLHTNDIALGSNSSITAASRTQMSVEGWFKFNTTADNQMLYVDATSGDFWRFIFGLYSSDCNTSRIAFSTRDTSTGDAGTREFICATAPAAGVWYHYFAVYDSGASSKVFYINGASDVSTGSSVGSFTATASSAVSVGDVTDHNYTMGGYADEVRVSNIARSADWVKTDYNNQISPSTFYSYGALGAGSRQDSSGAAAPTIKVRGGVKFH